MDLRTSHVKLHIVIVNDNYQRMSGCNCKEFGGFAERWLWSFPRPLWAFVTAQTWTFLWFALSPLQSLSSAALRTFSQSTEIPFGVLRLPVFLAPAVGTLWSSLCPHPPFLLCLPSVFAVMKILNSLLPKRAGVGRKSVGPILVGDKAVFLPHFENESIFMFVFRGTSVFPAVFCIAVLACPSGLRCNKAELSSWGSGTCCWCLELQCRLLFLLEILL